MTGGCCRIQMGGGEGWGRPWRWWASRKVLDPFCRHSHQSLQSGCGCEAREGSRASSGSAGSGLSQWIGGRLGWRGWKLISGGVRQRCH